MYDQLVYMCWIGFCIISVIFPILGKKKNSIELVTFFMSMGYGGYALSKSEEGVRNPITREEYIDKSFKIQMIFAVVNFIFILMLMMIKVNIAVAAIVISVLGISETIAFWKNLKRYTIKK